MKDDFASCCVRSADYSRNDPEMNLRMTHQNFDDNRLLAIRRIINCLLVPQCYVLRRMRASYTTSDKSDSGEPTTRQGISLPQDRYSYGRRSLGLRSKA